MRLIRYEHPTFSHFDRLFNWSSPALKRAFEPANENRTPHIDVQEDEHNYHVRLELPGIKKDELEIALDKAVLTVQAKSKSEEDKAKRNVSFNRAFTLPESVQKDKISAALEDGVLSVTLPKVEAAKPRTIKIK